jgi:hypothetical protein
MIPFVRMISTEHHGPVHSVHAADGVECLILGTKEDEEGQPHSSRMATPWIAVICPAALDRSRYRRVDRLHKQGTKSSHHHRSMTQHLPRRAV